MSAAMLSVRVGSACNVNSDSLGPFQLGPFRFSSAWLGLQCEWALTRRQYCLTLSMPKCSRCQAPQDRNLLRTHVEILNTQFTTYISRPIFTRIGLKINKKKAVCVCVYYLPAWKIIAMVAGAGIVGSLRRVPCHWGTGAQEHGVYTVYNWFVVPRTVSMCHTLAV